MKIVFTSNSSWSIYNFRKNLLLKLQSLGYHIIIVSPKSNYQNKLKDLGFECKSIQINSSSTGLISNIKILFNLYNTYKNIKPDIVLHNSAKPNIYGAIICRILNIPVVNNISGLGTLFLNNKVSSKIGRYLYKISQKKVHTVFFQNNDDMSLFLERNLVKKEQSQLIPGSGVDLVKFQPYEEKPNEIIKFAFIGRLLRDKGIFEYIQAAELILKKYQGKCKFYVLGELYKENPTAVTKQQLNKWIDEKIIIYLEKTDSVEEKMKNFDCIVLPSYREGLSKVLLEASAMGIPSITTNVPGCKHVVDNFKNGFICNVKDVNDLSKNIESFMFLSEEEKKQMSQFAREKAIKEFDENIVIDNYVKAIHSIKL